jgi:hypothetical protein
MTPKLFDSTIVGKANSSILHAPEDVTAGKPREIMNVAASVQATGVPREKLIGTDFSAYFAEYLARGKTNL